MMELFNYCMVAQREGLSANKALTLYRAAGLNIRRARFYEVWRAAAGAQVALVIPGLVSR